MIITLALSENKENDEEEVYSLIYGAHDMPESFYVLFY